jgi:hypothetical protein
MMMVDEAVSHRVQLCRTGISAAHPPELPCVPPALTVEFSRSIDGMGIFESIKHAIFGDKGPLGQSGGGEPPVPAQQPAAPKPAIPMAQEATSAAPAAAQPQAAAAQPVDVDAILTQKAAATGRPSNWRTSIVDLLQLLGLESSLAARKELATELDVHAGADGSAEQNIALHKAVMQKLAQNGGKVPADLVN